MGDNINIDLKEKYVIEWAELKCLRTRGGFL
jgi:hypothetical protein